MKKVVFWFILAAVAVPLSGREASAEEQGGSQRPVVEALAVDLQPGRATVSFRIANAPGPDTFERIDSGIPVTFRYRVEFVARRGFALWPARTLLAVTVENSVEYDSLIRSYALTRTVRRPGDKDAEVLEEHTQTGSPDSMRAFMTEIDDLEILDPRFPFTDVDFKVRIQSSLGRRYVLLIFPGNRSAKAEWRPER